MTTQRSTAEEVQAARELVESVEKKIRELRADDKKIHIIWDVDGVLVDSVSNDIFELTGRNTEEYGRYEDRLINQVPGEGPWCDLARRCGDLHHSQDIVTARARYSVLRVFSFCFYKGIRSREMLFIGSQSKAESYRNILQSFQEDKDYQVFLVDDSPRHVDEFKNVIADMKLKGRCHPVLAPRIRRYTQEQLNRHFKEVMNPIQPTTFLAPDASGLGQVVVEPSPHQKYIEMLMRMRIEALQLAGSNTAPWLLP